MYWITGILGFLLIAAPYMFGYTDNSSAFWTSGILGGLTVAASAIEWLRRGTEKWEYWVAGLSGIAAISAPFLFRFDQITQALWTTVGVGVLLTIFAGTKVFSQESTNA